MRPCAPPGRTTGKSSEDPRPRHIEQLPLTHFHVLCLLVRVLVDCRPPILQIKCVLGTTLKKNLSISASDTHTRTPPHMILTCQTFTCCDTPVLPVVVPTALAYYIVITSKVQHRHKPRPSSVLWGRREGGGSCSYSSVILQIQARVDWVLK
jgi:hypothetical protein